MQSSRVDGATCIQSSSFSTSVCVRGQHGTPTSDQPENTLQEKFPPTMSTAVVNSYGSTFSLSENLFPRNQLEKTFEPSDGSHTVFVPKAETSHCGKNNLSESSIFPNCLVGSVKSTDINASCSDSFQNKCSNKVVLNKLLDMQVKDCHNQGENSLADMIPHETDQGHIISNRSEELSNGEKENANAASISLDMPVNNSNCVSDEGSDGHIQDTYDHNSWILYGDSKLSVKNSWVLYGSSQSSSTQGSKREGEQALTDDSLSVGTGVNNFDENVTDSGLEKMMKDKESSYEELFKESRPYACSVCCKRFKLSHHLKEHMRIHTGEKPFPCPMCGERFSRSHLLRAHQARHAQESFPAVGTIFPCSKCMKIFESPQHLARHEKTHVQLYTHKCDICHKQFAHVDLLRKHKVQHTSLNSNDTEKCRLNSCMDLRIKQEPDDNNSPNLIVDSADDRDLQDFRKRCTSSNSECNKPTKENKQLEENSVLGEDNKVRSSEKKSPTVSEEKTLYDQSSWVLYGDANKESVCATMKERQMDNSQNSDGTTSASLYKGIDMNKLHELYMATNRSLFNRNGMMSPFYSMFEFNRHALMSLIDQTVVNSSSLPRPYTAKQNVNTESSFANRSRPHQCPHCSKRFKLSHHLREHLRIHTGEKPYHCDVCHERFSRSHLLQRHKTKHIADLTFHQVTDWIRKTSATSCDGNPNSNNEITDHFFMPHQEHQTFANQTDVNICMDEPTTVNSSVVNKQNNVQNHFSHSSDHKLGENDDDDLNYTKSNSGSEQASRDLANGDDGQSEDNDYTVPISHNVQTNQCTDKTGYEAGHAVPGIDYKSNTFDGISGLESASDSVDEMPEKVRMSHSNLGNSGTFQKTSSFNGISEIGYKCSSVTGTECVDASSVGIKGLECKSDIFNVSKMNLKSSSVVGFSSVGSRSDNIGLLGKDCLTDCVDGISGKGANSQEDHSDGDSCTDRTASHAHQSKQSGECSNQKNVNKSLCENNNDKEDESSSHSAPLKSHSRSPLATVQTESSSSEAPATDYSSSFPLNRSLNNNINLFNTGYLNYTHNLQQAMSSAAFKNYRHGDSLALDIPGPDFLRESFPSSLEYSNFFRSRRSGFMNCEFCGKWFADMNNLRQHMVSHSMDRHYSCHMCEKKFKRPHHLKEHMRIHTGEKPYVCDICDEKFSRSHILQRHRMKHGTSVPSDLYVQNDVYKICEQTRARSPEFVYDKLCSPNVIKSEPEAELSPSLCSDSNSDKKPVHEVVTSENQSDMADSDSGNVKTNISLEIKDYSQDFKSVLLTFVCRECGKKFANSSNLKQHMVSHFPERLFSCSVCNKKFKRSHHLKEHSRTHTGEKPYQCKRCGERFQRSHLLMKHKEKHHSRCGFSMHFSPGADTSTVKHNDYLSDEKLQHETTELPNADDATNISDLSESHTAADTDHDVQKGVDHDVQKGVDSDRGDQSGGEALSCDICNKEFSSEALLTVHKRTHPGDRPHQCASCGKHFALQYLLEVHEKSCV